MHITRVKGQLTAAGTFVGPVTMRDGRVSIFVSDSAFTGTLTVQIRPTPSASYPGTSIAEEPPQPAGTPEDWLDLLEITEAGLYYAPVDAQTPGNFDLQVGFKGTENPTGTAVIYLQSTDYSNGG